MWEGIMMGHQIEVTRGALAQYEIAQLADNALAEGAIACMIEHYALTANNITYAVMGEAMNYFDFFPASSTQNGVVPVWGFATVYASRHPDIAQGERLYGYWPMAESVVLQPAKVSKEAFFDGASHRAGLASVYNNYRRLGSDAADKGEEEIRALFEPLFLTSFLIEDTFRREDFYGASSAILTSASSKTALALAHVMKEASPHVRRIGLTSSGNTDFVAQCGLYDEVVSYEEVESLNKEAKTVSVDFAGNGDVLRRIHAHFDNNLAYSMLVGATHVDGRGGAKNLAGPQPILFFAPTSAETLMRELGPAGFEAAKAKRWNDFSVFAKALVNVTHVQGSEDIAAAYARLFAGNVAPTEGIIAVNG
jgi:hypothetical protein